MFIGILELLPDSNKREDIFTQRSTLKRMTSLLHPDNGL